MSEQQIIRDIATYGDSSEQAHRWSMVIDGETVSELWVEIATGEIAQVETPRQHRRNGYAAALYRQAAKEIAIYHAPASHRSPEGDAFAEAMGGPVAECPAHCYCTPTDEED
jgi:hypothetical protein